MPLEPFLHLVNRLAAREVRYVMIGLAAANYYASAAGQVFVTKDRDLFLPIDSANLLEAWLAARESGFRLWMGEEPMADPIDRWLADRTVSNRAGSTAIHAAGTEIDFTLEMTGFDFDTVWEARRKFRVDDSEIPVARLAHIVSSKARTNRPKDRLFLATYDDELRRLLKHDD